MGTKAKYEPTEPTIPVQEIIQQDYPVAALPVRSTGPTTTVELPSKCGAAFATALPIMGSNTLFVQVLGTDLRRKRCSLISDQDWQYARQASDRHGTFWPGRVPLVIEHTDAVYAAATTTAGSITAIVEIYSD